MTKYKIFITLCVALLFACDPEGNIDFYITNNCNENIDVYISYAYGNQPADTVRFVSAHSNIFIHTFVYNIAMSEKAVIKNEVYNVTVSNGDTLVNIEINPDDTTVWMFTHRRATLNINPEMFE
ncbi:hypothetical protein FACS189429_1940 [Bacteroidia bacterium]|nr:hypothetical protein FACS189429_1940 [Bacteroidia bacterium]